MIYINTTGKQNQVWLPKPYDIVIDECPDVDDAFNSGYTSGYTDGYDSGRTDGYDDGWQPGYDSGFTDGQNACSGESCEGVWEEGYGSGYTDGAASVDCQFFYDSGRTDGWNAGYPSGYTDGLNACSGGNEDLIANLQGDYFFIPEGTKNLRPYALYNTCYSAMTLPDSVEYIGDYAFGYDDCLIHMTIPSSVSGMGKDVFCVCRNLADVTFENTLSAIPADCFANCFSLTGITFPSGVTAINENGFYNCVGLSGITIPDTITEIKRSAFGNCSGLTEITIPSGVTKIPQNCFGSCLSLTSITIPSGITVFEGSAFAYCHNLSNVVLPEDLEIISGYAFEACYSITSVTFPENVSYIGIYAFRSCSGITEMTFKGEVPPTLQSTIYSLGSTAYTFPIYVPCESVEDYKTAFGQYYAPRIMCKTATGLSLNVAASIVGSGETTTTVAPQDAEVDLEYTSSDQTKATIDSAGTITVLDDGDVTFCVADAITELQDCKTVSVSLPTPANTNLLEIKYLTTGANQTNWLFAGEAQETNSYFDQFYSAITKMTVDGVEVQKSTSNIHRSNPRTTDYYFYTFPSAGKHTVKYYMSKNYTPATQLDDLVFADNLQHLHIVEAKLGSGYQQIKEGVFQGAEELTAVTIPNTVIAIGPYSFEYSGIEELTIPDSVTALTYEPWMTTGYGIFNNCTALTSVSIGTGLTTLPGYTFDGCTGLKTVSMSRTTPPTLGNNCFRNCSSLEHIYVPSESVNAYKTASGWSNYASIISAKP